MRPVRFLLGAALLGATLVGTGCASGSDDQRSASTTAAKASALVGPDEFAQRIEVPGVVTINVHIPNEGSIAGTDLSIPFDQIATSTELPNDRTTPLAVYCRSGNMSADAIRDLEILGYTDIVELDGGFNAWAAAGRSLDNPAGG